MAKIRIMNPLPGGAGYTSVRQALEYCRRGIAYMRNHVLTFRRGQPGGRLAGDVYVDARGTIWWNGARSFYVDGRDVSMYPPGCNVLFPKAGTVRAARRYAGRP